MRRARIVAVLAGVAIIAAVGVSTAGRYDTYPQASLRRVAGRQRAPAWTAPCWGFANDYPSADCARVSGRVVWLQRHDPDGDGDRHLILVSRLRLRIAKLRLGSGISTPGLGSHFSGVGVTGRGASGRQEVDIKKATT